MIVGIGTDIVEVRRVLEKIDKNRGFREATFSPEEIAYCEPKPNRGQHYAARFAAKEALLKAAGTGWTSAAPAHEITVGHEVSGRPRFQFAGAAAVFFAARQWTAIHLSITHGEDYAVAMVILEE